MSGENLFTYNEIESSKDVVIVESNKLVGAKSSSNDLREFALNDGIKIRVLLIGDEPYFVAMDIAKALDYKDTEAMTRRLDSDEIQNLQIVGFGNRGVNLISESGLYNAILGSNKPEAKTFKKWVTKEVLPSIRKTGSYGVAPKLPQTYAEALRELADKVEKVAELENKVAQDKPKVEYADKILSASNSVSFADFGRMLGSKGIKMGQNRLFALLKEQKYLMPNNEPYQKYVDCGYFELLPQCYKAGGKTITTYKTLITAKGQYYFANKLIPKAKQ